MCRCTPIGRQVTQVTDSAPLFRFSQSPGGIRFEFDVFVQRGERQRKAANFGSFEILCDEPAAIGGDDSAPPPLAYFASSIAF